jgi:hypothetical protein
MVWRVHFGIVTGGKPRVKATTRACQAPYQLLEIGMPLSKDLRGVFIGLDDADYDVIRILSSTSVHQ